MLLGLTESNAFAFAMIAILGVSLSFVLLIIVGVIRNARKHSEEMNEPPHEDPLEEQAQPAGNSSEKQKPEPWERKADWWKQDS